MKPAFLLEQAERAGSRGRHGVNSQPRNPIYGHFNYQQCHPGQRDIESLKSKLGGIKRAEICLSAHCRRRNNEGKGTQKERVTE